jgi:hypothetical protein
MRPVRWMHAASAVWLSVALVSVRPARGDASSDQAAALLVYPYVTVDSAEGKDTLLQISNTSDTPVAVRCFYEGAALDPLNGITDLKVADFQFPLTPRQPIAWRATQGAALPLETPGGPSQIPAVPTDPFTGVLRCIAVDRNLVPVERNVLVGMATLGQRRSAADSLADAAPYNAIGILARVGAGNGDDTIALGPSGEYDACPNFSVIPHFFDGALEPAAHTSNISTTLILVPCSEDLAHGIPGQATVTYEVFNEFEQRFGSSQHLQFQQVSALSAIGGANPDRSIFNVQVAGTLTGQTRIQTASGSGVLALAIETHRDLSDPTRMRRAAFNAHRLGTRDQLDTFVLPPSTPQPAMTPTNTGTATATPVVPTPTPTASATSTATASATRTATPTNTPTVTPPAPSPTQVATSNGGSCAITSNGHSDPATWAPVWLGLALILRRRARAR